MGQQPTRESGERRRLPQRGPGQSPGGKRLYCNLSVSERERLQLQHLLKIINVVDSRPLIEKKWVYSMARF